MINKRLLLIVLLIFFPFKSLALIEIDITRGNLNPLPLAVSSLASTESDKEKLKKDLNINDLGLEISKIVENNLKKSGLFNPLDKEAFLQKPDIAHLKPRFEDWALIKAQALITGKVNLQDNRLRVEFRLWDVLAGKEILALAFTTVPKNWRRVGHIISDKVYERLTGEKGYLIQELFMLLKKVQKLKELKN